MYIIVLLCMCIDEGKSTSYEQTRRRVPGDLLSSGQKQFWNGRDDTKEPPGTRNITIETSHIGGQQSWHGQKQRSHGPGYA